MVGAEFLGMILLIVYVGAVAVLFLFVVMMLNVTEQKQSWFIGKKSSHIPTGLIVSVLILLELLVVVGGWKFKENEENLSYEFEPEEDEILEDLLPKNISTQIFKAFLENAASEQGSRMTAMDNATRNAGDLVDKLTINYNRSRQASITKELIEIISGAESL